MIGGGRGGGAVRLRNMTIDGSMSWLNYFCTKFHVVVDYVAVATLHDWRRKGRGGEGRGGEGVRLRNMTVLLMEV